MIENTILTIALLIIFAKIFSYLSIKLKQPSILGILIIGFLLGPSVFNLFKVNSIIETFSKIGVIFIMFLAGLETNIDALKKHSIKSIWIAVGGVVFSFLLGFMVSIVFKKNLVESLFMGVLLTATSVSITVSTLMEIGKLQTEEGISIIGAAVIDDIFAILLLSFIIAMTKHTVSVGFLFVKIVIFFIGIVIMGFIISKFVLKIVEKSRIPYGTETLAIFTAFIFSFFAESSNIAAITGAYIAGLFISRYKNRKKIYQNVEVMAGILFIPFFFLTIGLSLNIRSIDGNLFYYISFISVAFIGKIVGSTIGGIMSGMNLRSCLRVGVGMLPRAEVMLVTALVGFVEKVITHTDYSIAILIVILTTFITPTLLKFIFRR